MKKSVIKMIMSIASVVLFVLFILCFSADNHARREVGACSRVSIYEEEAKEFDNALTRKRLIDLKERCKNFSSLYWDSFFQFFGVISFIHNNPQMF